MTNFASVAFDELKKIYLNFDNVQILGWLWNMHNFPLPNDATDD